MKKASPLAKKPAAKKIAGGGVVIVDARRVRKEAAESIGSIYRLAKVEVSRTSPLAERRSKAVETAVANALTRLIERKVLVAPSATSTRKRAASGVHKIAS